MKSKAAYISASAVTVNHNRCILFYSRTGTTVVEAIHLQKQIEKPGSAALICLLEPKAVLTRTASVSAITTHPTLKLTAVGTTEGIVTVYDCPFFDDPTGEGSRVESATGLATAASEEEGGDFANKPPVRGVSKRGGETAVEPSVGPRVILAAAISPDYSVAAGRIRKSAPSGASPPLSSPLGGEPADAVVSLAFHPTLPLLAATDGTGRLVIWRIGVSDGVHATIGSREAILPHTIEDTPRVVTSMVFHATLPRLITMGYSPSASHFPPVLQAWCTAHASLPPLPSPSTPALMALMYSAATDPFVSAQAYAISPPVLLVPLPPLQRQPVVWVASRVICCSEVFRSSAAIGTSVDDDIGYGALATTGSTTSTALLSARLTPHHAGGVVFNAAVADTLPSPRAWFVTGMEGERVDLGLDSLDQDKPQETQSSLSDGGSLAHFAARLVGGMSATQKTAKEEAKKDEAAATLASGLPKRINTLKPALPVDCLLYIQSRSEVVNAPPRLVIQYSLQVRPIGAPTPKDGAGGAAEDVTDAAKRLDPSWMQRVKRVCWLPSYGPNGPLVPLSIQRSPSGRYILVRFAYLTESLPGKLTSPASSGVGTSGRSLLSSAALAKTPSKDNAAGKKGSDPILYVIVGPITGEEQLTTVNPGVPVDFEGIQSGCPVSGLATAVDVNILAGDRLLVVRRPNLLSVDAKADAGNYTEYIVAVEPLELDITEVGKGSVRTPQHKAAENDKGGDDGFEIMRGKRRKDLAMTPLKFGVHDPVFRVFSTPFRIPRVLPTSITTGIAEGVGTLPGHSIGVTAGMTNEAAALFDDDLSGPNDAVDGTIDGDVLLYVTRFRRPGFDEEDEDPLMNDERQVIRYSNNAYGAYDRKNAHGYAIVHAYDPLLGSAGPLRPIGGSVSSGLTSKPMGLDPFAIPASNLAPPAVPTMSQSLLGTQMTVMEQWKQHEAVTAACPFEERPVLVLGPGEIVLRITFQPHDTTGGDSGLHEDVADPPVSSEGGKLGGPAAPALGMKRLGGPTSTSAPLKAVVPPSIVKRLTLRKRLTVPEAIASGAPLLSILTSHRLLVCSPSLHVLVAIPVLAPLGGCVGAGLGTVAASSLGQSEHIATIAANSLELPDFGMLNGIGCPRDSMARGDEGSEGEQSTSSIPERFNLGNGYVANVEARAHVNDVGSTTFGLPVNGLSPVDASATFQGGVLINTVASAAALGARLISPAPATRISDTIPSEDVSEEAIAQFHWQSPIVSHLWVGSAVLFTTTSGDVWYVTPTGRAVRVASLEGCMRDAVLITALPDRLVFACTAKSGRIQIRYRAFSPLEPLVVSAIDMARVRPRARVSLKAAALHSQLFGRDMHKVIEKLYPFLSASIAVYTATPSTAGASKGGNLQLVHGSGETAVSLLTLAAVARDYNFVKNMVARYATPSATHDGRSSRVLVAALQQAGLLDLAFYSAHGYAYPDAKPRDTTGQPPHVHAHAEGVEVDDSLLPWLASTGFPFQIASIPSQWRAELGLLRDRTDQSIVALCAEDPHLAGVVSQLLRKVQDVDTSHVKLPTPFSPAAVRLRALGASLLMGGNFRAALLCFDLAGDYSSTYLTSVVASTIAAVRGMDGGGLARFEIDGALAAIADAAADRYPGLGALASLRRVVYADDANRIAKQVGEESGEERGGEESDDENENTQETNNGSNIGLLDSLIKRTVYPATALGRTTRPDVLMPFDYAVGTSPLGLQRKLDAITSGRNKGVLVPFSDSSFVHLLDVGRDASIRAAETKLAAVYNQRESDIILLPVATISGAIYRKILLAGGTVHVDKVAPLDTHHTPLAFDSIQRHIGTCAPQSRRVGGMDGMADDDGDMNDDVADEMSLDAMLGGLGQAAREDFDAMTLAALTSRGKRRLRALPRGQEDAVLGYWRFDKSEEEAAAEKVRWQELRKSGVIPSGVSKPEGIAGGVWGIAHGTTTKESLSVWNGALPDLSKQGAAAYLFDALFLFARVRGSTAATSLLLPVEGAAPSGHCDLVQYARVGLSTQYDSPCEAGDLSKVREPRVLVVGVSTLRETADQSTPAIIPAKTNPVNLAKAPADAVAVHGGPGLPPMSLTNDIRLLSQLCVWGGVVPIARFTYLDVGVRPFDAVNAAFTIEAWFKVGYPYTTALPAQEMEGEEYEEDADGSAPQKLKAKGNDALKVGRELLLFARTERYAKIPAPSTAIAAANEVGLRYQWSLSVRPDGNVVFASLPGTPEARDLTTKSPVVSFGEWVHVALVVDASNAAKEAAARMKAAHVTNETATLKALGNPAPIANGPPIHPAVLSVPLVYDSVSLSDAVVRVYINGDQVIDGKVSTAMPLPLLDLPAPPTGINVVPGAITNALRTAVAATCDHLLVAPDFVGRVSEVRLWAKKRSSEEIADSKDFHLDLAESKRTKMQIVIKPATVGPTFGAPVPSLTSPVNVANVTPSAALPTAQVPQAASALPPIKKPALSAPSAAPAGRRRLPGSAGTPAAGLPSVAEGEVMHTGASVPEPASEGKSATGSTPTSTAAGAGREEPSFESETDSFDSFGHATAAVKAPIVEEDDDFKEPVTKSRPSLISGSGLKPPGGLGAPPPGGGGKKAALLRAAAQK
jgi:hypothetical protein